MSAIEDDLERTRCERDLYYRLLHLGVHGEIKPFLNEALQLIVEAIGARLAYFELQVDRTGSRAMRWFAAHGLGEREIDHVRGVISTGIVAEALATGNTIVTPSAFLDPRFAERSSVRIGMIEAVLCAPIEASSPLGVLYLQGHPGAEPFSEHDRETVELFARVVSPLAERLISRERSINDPTLDIRERLRCTGVIGRSESLANLLGQIALIAPLDVSVLLTGESGTGKSQVARVIHENSPRARAPFVELNCGALPETLIESELFGAMPGAHSTAVRRMEGKVAAAEKGTLFLDEIGDLAQPSQAKLLQLLQSRQYYPLGSSRPVPADVRVIAATNVDLNAAVSERRFREDLFYRLQVLPLRMPSLAERRDDIPELAGYFCGAASDRHGLPKLEVSPNALRAAELADWPGNIRQLAHALEAALIRATGEGARRIESHHVFPGSLEDTIGDTSSLTFQEATRRFQSRMLRDALDANNWNVAQVAQRLDLARSHLYTLIRAFGLKRE
jgi:transcriptional regulator with GAF, ATPase, and Fis domain